MSPKSEPSVQKWKKQAELRQKGYELLLSVTHDVLTPELLEALAGQDNELIEAERVISNLSPSPGVIWIDRREWDIYLAVEDYGAPRARERDVLIALFGATPDDPATLTRAELQTLNGQRLKLVRQVHAKVARQMKLAEETGRGWDVKGEPLSLPARKVSKPTRPVRPSTDQLFEHLNRRAGQLGIATTDVLAKRQGSKGDPARALIVAELCDEVGASLAQVAALFGCHRNAIAALRDKGRKPKQEKLKRYEAAWQQQHQPKEK